MVKNWKILVCVLALAAVGFLGVPKARADFNSSDLISEGEFTNINTMDAATIQRFLERQGGFLKSYSENGRSAAQIIYDAAHGYGDASGSINGISINASTGTVNPGVILVTLQKEQSLITMASRNDNSLRTAMGYACPDSGGCNSSYTGFTKQVENGAWQLRYNYERAQGHGFSDYQAGQGFCFSDWNGQHCGTFGNRATASLYRYTPHVYNGNYNFWNLYFNVYRLNVGEYSSSYVTQSRQAYGMPGSTQSMSVTFKNTGSQTWYKNSNHPVILAVHYRKDMEPFNKRFRSGGWVSADRIARLPNDVAPGATVTIPFTITIPPDIGPGLYQFYTQLVCEGYTWFNENGGGAWWYVDTNDIKSSYVTQSRQAYGMPGSTQSMSVTFKNTGSQTWYKNSNHPVILAVHYRKDMEPFNKRFRSGGWVSADRIARLPNDVAPGATVTIPFTITIPSDIGPGLYQFYTQLVCEGYTWLNENGGGAWWYVDTDDIKSSYVNQSGVITGARGSTQNVSVTFKNTGSQTWYKNSNHPVILAVHYRKDMEPFNKRFRSSGWVSADRIARLPNDVAPGATVTIPFSVTIPPDLDSGRYQLFTQLVCEGYKWFSEYGGGAWWYANVL